MSTNVHLWGVGLGLVVGFTQGSTSPGGEGYSSRFLVGEGGGVAGTLKHLPYFGPTMGDKSG